MRPLALAVALTAAALAPVPEAAAQAPPDRATCAQVRAHRTAPPVVTYDRKPGAVRVFAMQFKQEVRHIDTYAAFRTKIECMVREYVVPRLARGRGRVNVVAFNEDIGLMTAGTGSRGAQARQVIANPGGAPGCEGQAFPCATLATLAALNSGYSKELAAYRARFPQMSPASGVFVAATDTFARGWMQTFSDVARRYGIYILGSNNQAPFRESSDPADIEAFADPDHPRPASVFVATSPDVYNEVFMWAPRDVRGDGPPMLRNVVAQNKKVPLTPIEQTLELAPGPATGPAAVDNVRPYPIPGTRAKVAFATSLPAFVYGDPPPGVDPCSDTSKYYMRCVDKLGANVVMQDEANPGRWTGEDGDGIEKWQPLSWMTSTWRAAADPTVAFDYNVTPHLVGNLADLAFDGQTAITQRRLRGPACHYVGNERWIDGEDRPDLKDEAGPKREFLAIAPWVTGSAPRDDLRAVGARLAPGSGDALENDYLETAVVADLTFPRDPGRIGCAQEAGSRRARLAATPRRVRAGRRVTLRFTVRTGRKPLRAGSVWLRGREYRVDRRGRALARVKLPRGTHTATFARPGYRRVTVKLRAAR